MDKWTNPRFTAWKPKCLWYLGVMRQGKLLAMNNTGIGHGETSEPGSGSENNCQSSPLPWKQTLEAQARQHRGGTDLLAHCLHSLSMREKRIMEQLFPSCVWLLLGSNKGKGAKKLRKIVNYLLAINTLITNIFCLTAVKTLLLGILKMWLALASVACIQQQLISHVGHWGKISGQAETNL